MIPTGRGGSYVQVNQPHGWEEKQLMTFFVLKLKVKARSKVAALSELIYFVDGEPLCFFFFISAERTHQSTNAFQPHGAILNLASVLLYWARTVWVCSDNRCVLYDETSLNKLAHRRKPSPPLYRTVSDCFFGSVSMQYSGAVQNFWRVSLALSPAVKWAPPNTLRERDKRPIGWPSSAERMHSEVQSKSFWSRSGLIYPNRVGILLCYGHYSMKFPLCASADSVSFAEPQQNCKLDFFCCNTAPATRASLCVGKNAHTHTQTPPRLMSLEC